MEYWIIGDEFLDEEPKREADAQGYLKELIRCKDCKYWNGSGKYCDYEMSGLENDFCSWAERKEE